MMSLRNWAYIRHVPAFTLKGVADGSGAPDARSLHSCRSSFEEGVLQADELLLIFLSFSDRRMLLAG